MLHLGTLDESLVRPQDLYLCIRPTPVATATTSSTSPEFCVGCCSAKTGRVIFRPLPVVDNKNIANGTSSLSPLLLEEMLAEELPQLLQTLLVGVERVICRLPLDDLSFPSLSHNNNDNPSSMVSPDTEAATTYNSVSLSSCSSSSGAPLDSLDSENGQRRPIESGLKRRELITKNKMMGTKYALLRAIKSENSNSQVVGGVGSGQAEALAMDQLHQQSLSDDNAGFCLGGGLAFPHIDSDEESVDEATKRSGSGNGT